MGNSTFNGPVRSENGFVAVTKNADTGVITQISTYGSAPVALTDADTDITNALHSGGVVVVPAVGGNRTLTLPAPVAGANFKIIYGGAAEETENLIIDTGADANFFIGGIAHLDSDADNVSVYSDGNSNSKLTLTDFGLIEINIVAKDSTNWYIWGYAQGADAPAFADQP